MSGTAIHDALRGVKAALPFWLGFFPLGFILGAQACHKGMSVPTAAAMSFFNYAGGSEFAAVALWTATPPLLLIAFTTWLINSRHIVMGMALSLYTRKLSTGKSLFAFFLMCDEVWAVSMQEISRRKAAGVPEDECFCYAFHVGTGLGFWLPWTCSTALGAFMGGTLGDLNQWGFSMAYGKRYRFGRLQFLAGIALVRPFGNADGARACSLSASAFRKPSRLRNSYGNTDCRYLVSA